MEVLDLFKWNKQKIELYKRAAEYTEYNDEMGKIIAKEIGEGREIWDLGCGMSQLSLSLSNISEKIYCIDICDKVLNILEEVKNDRDINNVEIINMDYKDFIRKRKKGDCIIVSHFLDIYKNMDLLLNHCKTLIIIKNSRKRVSDSVRNKSKQTIEEIERNILNTYYKDIDYRKKMFNGDFGQPLKSISEAQEYYELYARESISEEEIKEYLIDSKDEKYPYYYPKDKTVGMLIIDGKLK